jgi:hypothetical protein
MSIMKQLATRTAVVALLVVGVGAAAAAPGSAQEGPSASDDVRVDNARGVPVTVYLEHGAYDTRIGTVPPRSRKDLALPIALRDGDRLYFTVHPEGGADLYTRDGIVVRRGERLALYVPTNDVGFVPPPPRETIANPGLPGATLTVENSSDGPVDAFIERGAFDTRVGTVPAGEERTFAIPEAIARERETIDIFLHVEGAAEDLESSRFNLSPDAHLLVKVPR